MLGPGWALLKPFGCSGSSFLEQETETSRTATTSDNSAIRMGQRVPR